jgi:pyruvate carboxylase
VSNKLTPDEVISRGESLSFPESVRELLRGDIGQPLGGWPADIQRVVLKDEKPFTDRPNEHLAPIDFDKEWAEFEKTHPYAQFTDLLSSLLYPKVFEDYWTFRKSYGDVSRIPTPVFFFGLKEGEESIIEIARGKSIIIRLQSIGPVNEEGMRTMFFTLNGQTRNLEVRDQRVAVKAVHNAKADRANTKQLAAPLQGMLSKVLVEAGQQVPRNAPLFVIEAMKMETTITAPDDLTVASITLGEGTRVQADDLVLTVE